MVEEESRTVLAVVLVASATKISTVTRPARRARNRAVTSVRGGMVFACRMPTSGASHRTASLGTYVPSSNRIIVCIVVVELLSIIAESSILVLLLLVV